MQMSLLTWSKRQMITRSRIVHSLKQVSPGKTETLIWKLRTCQSVPIGFTLTWNGNQQLKNVLKISERVVHTNTALTVMVLVRSSSTLKTMNKLKFSLTCFKLTANFMMSNRIMLSKLMKASMQAFRFGRNPIIGKLDTTSNLCTTLRQIKSWSSVTHISTSKMGLS